MKKSFLFVLTAFFALSASADVGIDRHVDVDLKATVRTPVNGPIYLTSCPWVEDQVTSYMPGGLVARDLTASILYGKTDDFASAIVEVAFTWGTNSLLLVATGGLSFLSTYAQGLCQPLVKIVEFNASTTHPIAGRAAVTFLTAFPENVAARTLSLGGALLQDAMEQNVKTPLKKIVAVAIDTVKTEANKAASKIQSWWGRKKSALKKTVTSWMPAWVKATASTATA